MLQGSFCSRTWQEVLEEKFTALCKPNLKCEIKTALFLLWVLSHFEYFSNLKTLAAIKGGQELQDIARIFYISLFHQTFPVEPLNGISLMGFYFFHDFMEIFKFENTKNAFYVVGYTTDIFSLVTT